MSRTARARCSCGGELPRPLPVRCPHCDAVLSKVRHASPLAPLLFVAGLFALLAAFLGWLLSR